MKQKTKIYIRTFSFADGTKESVETADGKKMTKEYTGKWARKKFKKDKITETKDTVRYEI